MSEEKKRTYLPLRYRQADDGRGKLRAGSIFLDVNRVPSQPNQSLMDAVRVLQVVVFRAQPVAASDVARELNIDVTRAHRLLRTLSLLGMTHQTQRKRFTPGPAMHVLAAQSLLNSDLPFAARGPLDEVAQSTGLEVAMGMLWQEYVSYIYHAAPDFPIESAAGNVSIFPASYSSLGRVLMSELPEAHVRQMYADRPIVGYEQSGIEALLVDLRQAKADGFARVERKTQTGRVTIAIHVPSRPFAAIGIGGEISEAATPGLVEVLRSAARQIDAVLEQFTHAPSARR